MDNAIVLGVMLAESDNINRRIDSIYGDAREQVVMELIGAGVLLPPITWDAKEVDAKAQAIIDEWFSRHPEIQKGTGQFQEKYPHIVNAQTTLFELLNRNRLKEAEFFTLFEALYNF